MHSKFSNFRAALDRLPRYPLAHLPTPIELLPFTLGGRRVFIKRDDCTGFALGGNKSRKLEYSLAKARAEDASVLLTASGIQSNHVRQTAAAAAKAGMKFHAILAPALDRFPLDHLRSGNVLIDTLFGAVLHVVETEAHAEEKIAELVAELSAAGERPFVIPLGASDGTGSLGYAKCALELVDQFEQMDINPDEIVLPTGSGGTHGGLLAGLRGGGSKIAVTGISVSDSSEVKRAKVMTSIEGIRAVLDECEIPVCPDEIIVHDQFAGAGYAHATPEADAWVIRLARTSAIMLDPVYTAKAFAGMAALAAEGGLQGKGDIVFLHTGGSPVLFADPLGLVDPLGMTPDLAALTRRVQR